MQGSCKLFDLVSGDLRVDIPDGDTVPISQPTSISSTACFCIKRQLLDISSNSVVSLISV